MRIGYAVSTTHEPKFICIIGMVKRNYSTHINFGMRVNKVFTDAIYSRRVKFVTYCKYIMYLTSRLDTVLSTVL